MIEKIDIYGHTLSLETKENEMTGTLDFNGQVISKTVPENSEKAKQQIIGRAEDWVQRLTAFSLYELNKNNKDGKCIACSIRFYKDFLEKYTDKKIYGSIYLSSVCNKNGDVFFFTDDEDDLKIISPISYQPQYDK